MMKKKAPGIQLCYGWLLANLLTLKHETIQCNHMCLFLINKKLKTSHYYICIHNNQYECMPDIRTDLISFCLFEDCVRYKHSTDF
jgi:hypothetical protein